MADDSTGATQRLSALIAEIEAEAYARGRADARKELLEMLGAGQRAAPARERRGNRPGAAKRRSGGRRRAPKGSVPRFVERALRERPGATVREILELVATDAERQIAPPSIRVELRNGRTRGRYVSNDGRWSLAASSAAADEDGSPDAPPDAAPEGDEVGGAPVAAAATETTASLELEGERMVTGEGSA